MTVVLRVRADTSHRWIALVDPLPAGFEVVNPRLAAGGAVAAGGDTWTHQDLRDDRVQWFADDLPSGGYEVRYQARATIDGAFTAAPATIEAMYHPELRARTAQATIAIAP